MTKDCPACESLEQTADATAAGLAQTAVGAAFQLFREKQFRRLAGFEQLSQVEQDRIFNELVVAFVVLIMLLLEAPDLRVAGESRDYLANLIKSVPKANQPSSRLGKAHGHALRGICARPARCARGCDAD